MSELNNASENTGGSKSPDRVYTNCLHYTICSKICLSFVPSLDVDYFSSNIWEQQGYKDLLLTKFCMDSNFGAGLSLSRQQRPNKPEARWGMDIVRDKRRQSDKRCDTAALDKATISEILKSRRQEGIRL